MARPTKYVEVKLCNSCRLNVNYKKFRLIKPLTKGPNKGKLVGWTEDTNYSPSFDRIYPKKGYVKGNIVIVSNKANRIKTDATVDEIRKVADFYEKLLKDK